MFDMADIRQVQKARPDLNEDQAAEVLGFLNDMYSIEPFEMSGQKLFKETADMVFPL